MPNPVWSSIYSLFPGGRRCILPKACCLKFFGPFANGQELKISLNKPIRRSPLIAIRWHAGPARITVSIVPRKERRKYIRLKTAAQVEVIAGLSGWSGPQLIRGNCLNMSVHGALLLLPEKLAPADEVLVLFVIRPQTIECAAKVLRVEPTIKLNRWRIACEFQGVSSLTFKLLDQYIISQLRSRVGMTGEPKQRDG